MWNRVHKNMLIHRHTCKHFWRHFVQMYSLNFAVLCYTNLAFLK